MIATIIGLVAIFAVGITLLIVVMSRVNDAMDDDNGLYEEFPEMVDIRAILEKLGDEK